MFAGDLTVDTILRESAPYFPEASFVPGKTALIFEEIGDCSRARTALKSFALDKRFDVLATGSLLGVINYRRKTNEEIPTGFEKVIEMSSLDFEEFLWANGVEEASIQILKDHLANGEPLSPAIEAFYQEMIKRYLLIGGMPKAVTEYLSTNNYIKSREYLQGLIVDYRTDFGRFINEKGEEEIDYKLQAQLNQVFDAIPSQLSRESETHKFKYSDVRSGGRASNFEEPFQWLEKSGLVLRCKNLKAIETPLKANSDPTYFKAFLADIGLLMALFPVSVSIELLEGRLGSRKGAIYENLIATMIHKVGLPLYYFSNGTDHLEIDFIFESATGIVLLEEKSTNGKMAASRAVMEGKTKYKAEKCYKVIQGNFGKGDFFETIPQCAVPFLLQNIAGQMKEGATLPPLDFPTE